MGEVFLDRYEAEREVGQGGMAVVYRGMDRVLHRPVAIKVLHAHLAQKAEARARFAREARVIAKLRHPNVVEVYDFAGEEADRAFIIAEFVEGKPLSDFLDDHGPMLPEVAALVTAAVARALHHAHEQGVIHRDVKPENIMVRRDGVLKLMDFGIAHVVDMEHLTMTGAIIGSPAHMSPEQVDGRALDARTDIFSLGTLFYLMASGAYPFSADTASGLLKQIVEAKVPDIRALRPGFPDGLYAVLRKMMARNPADRYQTAAEVADALTADVAAVGIGRDGTDLAKYFLDPEGYTARARAVIAEARLRRARECLRQRKPALAIRELDGVLANDPGNDEARRWLERAKKSVRRRAVSRTAALTAAAGGMAIGLAVAAIRLAPLLFGPAEEPAPAAAPPAAAPAIGLRQADLLPSGAARRGLDQVPFRARNGRPPKAPVVVAVAPKPEETGIPVTIVASPPAVRILVDGRVIGYGTTGEIRLPPGRHSVRLQHPTCAACRETEDSFVLDPSHPPERPLRFSIGYREAILTVTGPAGGRVSVNGVPRGRTNEPIRVPMQGPAPVSVQVTVRFDGQPDRIQRVTLEAGQSAILAL